MLHQRGMSAGVRRLTLKRLDRSEQAAHHDPRGLQCKTLALALAPGNLACWRAAACDANKLAVGWSPLRAQLASYPAAPEAARQAADAAFAAAEAGSHSPAARAQPGLAATDTVTASQMSGSRRR